MITIPSVIRVREVVLFLTLASGCSQSPPSTSHGAQRDSAGVLVVTLPDLTQANVPRWTTKVLFSTEGGELPPLTGFADARLLPDSSVLVTHESELLHLAATGRLLGTVGRAGSGPGEYHRAFRLGISPAGEIMVSDFDNQRATLLDHSLQMRRIIPRIGIATSYELEAFGFLDRNRIVVGYWQHRPNRGDGELTLGGHDRDSAPILLFDSLGAPHRWLGLWPGLERVPVAFGRIPPPFARSTLFQSRGRYTAITPTDSLAVTLLADTAVVLQLRGGVGSRQPTQQDMQGFEEGVRTELADVVALYLEAVHRSASVPRMPALGALAVDGEGNTWVGTTPAPGDSLRTWYVLSRQGEPLGWVSLPCFTAVAIPGWREILDVDGERLLLLRQSPDGEITLELRQVIRAR